MTLFIWMTEWATYKERKLLVAKGWREWEAGGNEDWVLRTCLDWEPLAALCRGPGLTGQLTTVCYFSSRGSGAFSWPPRAPAHMRCTENSCMHTHTQNLKKKSKPKKHLFVGKNVPNISGSYTTQWLLKPINYSVKVVQNQSPGSQYLPPRCLPS